ncbi:MAG: hypothetical protein AA908_11405 [Chlorobi bacterium NICIL-2]|nr:MAG: hypothetical protein AA908_11405 [Chlorobi bacterium NICIL-2]
MIKMKCSLIGDYMSYFSLLNVQVADDMFEIKWYPYLLQLIDEPLHPFPGVDMCITGIINTTHHAHICIGLHQLNFFCTQHFSTNTVCSRQLSCFDFFFTQSG